MKKKRKKRKKRFTINTSGNEYHDYSNSILRTESLPSVGMIAKIKSMISLNVLTHWVGTRVSLNVLTRWVGTRVSLNVGRYKGIFKCGSVPGYHLMC